MKCQVVGCIREARTSYALCDTDTYRALTGAFGPRTSTGLALGTPLPLASPAAARTPHGRIHREVGAAG